MVAEIKSKKELDENKIAVQSVTLKAAYD